MFFVWRDGTSKPSALQYSLSLRALSALRGLIAGNPQQADLVLRLVSMESPANLARTTVHTVQPKYDRLTPVPRSLCVTNIDLRVSVGFSWERGLRTVSKTPVKKPKVPQEYSPGTKSAIGRVLRKGGKGVKGRGVRGDGGGGRGGTGEGGRAGGKDGRPSIGTWTKTQNYLQILKELSGKVQ